MLRTFKRFVCPVTAERRRSMMALSVTLPGGWDEGCDEARDRAGGVARNPGGLADMMKYAERHIYARGRDDAWHEG